MRKLAPLPLLLLLGAGKAQKPLAEMSAHEIIDKANKVLRGDSSYAELSMSIATPEWERTLEMEGWNEGRKMALIIVHKPAKDRDTTTLRRGEQMWMFLPKVERTIKIPPTMMHSSWMGSDFTYEDIVKADSVVTDYTHSILKRESKGEYEEFVIEALPKDDAPVVWGKVIMEGRVYADNTDVIPLVERDYSERGELIRTITMSEVEWVQGHRVPTKLECVPHKKAGRKTTLKYHKIVFDKEYPKDFFGLQRLQRRRR